MGDHGCSRATPRRHLMQLTEVEPYADGRFDIEVVGRQRMRLHDLDNSGPYLAAWSTSARRPDEPEAEAEAERRWPRSRPTGGSRRAPRRARPVRRPAARPDVPVLVAGHRLPAHAARAPVAAGGARHRDPAGAAAPLAGQRAARDEGRTLPPRDRGGAHPVEPQLMARRRTVGTPATVALEKAGVTFTVHPYDHDPRSASYGLEAADGSASTPTRSSRPCSPRSTASWSSRSCPSADSST